MMINRSAYFFVVHGSRNLNYGQQLSKLLSDIESQLTSPGRSISLATAYLELAPQPLHEAIIAFAQQSVSEGYESIKVFPLFLLSGTHVLHDIPEQLALAQAKSSLPLELMPHLGSCDDLITLLRSQFEIHHRSERVLLTHGTSIVQGNQELEAIAHQLKAKVAYWSMQPSLNSVINNLIFSQVESVMILPYFLFTGKITEAIENEIKVLQTSTPMNIFTLPTLAQTNRFVQTVIQWMGFVESHHRS